MKIWWLSFADPSKPSGEQFLGACMVKAESLLSAAATAYTNGVNPGGEVLGFELDDDQELLVRDDELYRLYSRAETEALDAELSRRNHAGALESTP